MIKKKKKERKNRKTSSHLLTLLLTNDFAPTYNVPNKQPYSGVNIPSKMDRFPRRVVKTSNYI